MKFSSTSHIQKLQKKIVDFQVKLVFLLEKCKFDQKVTKFMQSLIKFLQIQKGILQYDHFSSSKKCKVLTDSQVKLNSRKKKIKILLIFHKILIIFHQLLKGILLNKSIEIYQAHLEWKAGWLLHPLLFRYQPLCALENSNCTTQNTKIFRTITPRYIKSLINRQQLNLYPHTPSKYFTQGQHRHSKWRSGYFHYKNYPPLHQLFLSFKHKTGRFYTYSRVA